MKKVFLFISGLIIGGAIVSASIQRPSIQTSRVPQEKRLDTMTILTLPIGDLQIMFYPTEVYFMPLENFAHIFKTFSLTKEQYPELFKEGDAGMSFLSAEAIKDTKPESPIVRISNNQPDHGYYSTAFWVTVDPVSGKVLSDASREKTEVIDYVQSYVPTEKKSGNCWTTSIAAVENSKAYRCMQGNNIYDPCFTTSDKEAVCNVDPEKQDSGFTLELTEQLPTMDRPSTSVREPWIVKLSNGLRCTRMTGTAGDIENYGVYYFCDKNAVLLNGIDQIRNLWEVKVGYPDSKFQKLLKTEDVTASKAWW